MTTGLDHLRDFDHGSEPEADRPADDILLRIEAGTGRPERMLKITRRHAVLGRGVGSDVWIDDPAVSERHLYLHLDPRGLFAIDLATRTGTRFNGRVKPQAQLRAGATIEVAGHRIEVLRLRCNHQILPAHNPSANIPVPNLLARTPLDPAGASSRLACVFLEPVHSRETAWSVESELVVIGRSPHCGISIPSPRVARTHCVLARDPEGAVLVNLVGRDVWIEDQPVTKSTRLDDGDFLAVGSAGFHARIKPTAPVISQPPALPATVRSQNALEGWDLPVPPALETLSPESREALWGWILSAIHACQLRILERQDEYLSTIVRLLAESQRSPHLPDASRLARIEEELVSLREALRTHESATAFRGLPPPPNPIQNQSLASAPANSRAAETNAPASIHHPSASWLLERVQELDRDSQSAFRSLLDRLTRRIT